MIQLNDMMQAKGGLLHLPVGEDKSINLSKLSPGDQADAAAFLVSQRYARAEASTAMMPILADARAKMLADIACAPVYLSDVMDDLSCRIKLIQLGAARAKQNISFDQLKAALQVLPAGVMQHTILWLLNLEDKTNEVENPPSEGGTTGN